MTEPPWLAWARRLQAIARNGLTYATDPFDQERFTQVQEIAAELFAAGSDTPLEAIRGLFSEQVGYATPKVDVRGVVFRDDALLLVRERDEGRWTLPGGWADPLEAPSEAVVREVFEESGYRTRASKLLAVLDRSKHPHHPPFAFHVYKLFIRCDLLGGEATHNVEVDAVGFFREDELPALSSSRITEGQLRRCFAHRLHPDWPADFD